MAANPKTRQSQRDIDSVAPSHEAVVEKEPNFLEESLGYAIRRAQVRCDALLVHHLDSEISPARLSALCCVGANPGISQIELGSLLNIAGPSIVKVVDDLEKRQFVQRVQSTDRRVYALHLTKTGRASLRRYATAVKRFETAIANSLSHKERDQFLLLLEKVAAGNS